MKKILIAVFSLISFAAFGQVEYDSVSVVDPQDFPEAVTIDTADIQFLSRKNNLNRRVNPATLRSYVSTDVWLGWPAVAFDTTGNSSTYYFNIVPDSTGDVWYIDAIGRGRQLEKLDLQKIDTAYMDADTLYLVQRQYDDTFDTTSVTISGGGGGGAIEYSESTLGDTSTFWWDSDNHVNAYVGQWTRIAPDRQFLTVSDLVSNTNNIPARSGEVLNVNAFSSVEGRANYLVVSSIDTVNEYHIRDTTFFELAGGKYAVLSKDHNDYIFPEMVGAVGDGVADDSRALTIAHYYSLNVRYGFQKSYRTTISIPILPRQTIDLNESTIYQEQNYLYPAFDAVIADNATIKNGTIQGVDTLINPEIVFGDPNIWETIDGRFKVGDVYHQTGILAQDADSLVIRNMNIHNYRQGIMVLNVCWLGPDDILPWYRGTDPDYTGVSGNSNWGGCQSDMRVYVYDTDLSYNLFGLLGGGTELIYLDGIRGNVLPPDTMPVQIYANPHLIYTSSGDGTNEFILKRFVGKNIKGLPSKDVQDVSILKLGSVIDAYVENLFVDSIETALEFYGQNLIARNIHGKRMYGGFLRLYDAGTNIPRADTVIRVVENVSAEFINPSNGNFNYAVQINQSSHYTIRNATFSWADPNNQRNGNNLPNGFVNFNPIELISSSDNYIENVHVDWGLDSDPIGNVVRFNGTCNNNIIKELSCDNCEHLFENDGGGLGNYIEYNPSHSRLNNIENTSIDQRAWESGFYTKVLGGEIQGIVVNNEVKLSFKRGLIGIVDEAKSPVFFGSGTGGPDYPVFLKIVNVGGAIPTNSVNGYLSYLGTEGDFEYPYTLPEDGETIIYEYIYNETTQKFELVGPVQQYKENAYSTLSTDQNVDRILDFIRVENRNQIYDQKLVLDYDNLSDYDHAYGLERLTQDYFGPLIRVVRLSDNEELDILYRMVTGKINEGQLNNFCNGTTCRVLTVYDQLGNIDLEVKSGSTGPIIYESGAMLEDAIGNPYLKFEAGQNQVMLADNSGATSRFIIRARLNNANGVDFRGVLRAVGASNVNLFLKSPNGGNPVFYGTTYSGYTNARGHIDETYIINGGVGGIMDSLFVTYFDYDVSTSMTEIELGENGGADDLFFQFLAFDNEASGSQLDEVKQHSKIIDVHYAQSFDNPAFALAERGDTTQFVWSKLGINTSLPTTSLDINGDLRVRSVTEDSTLTSIAVLDADGNLKYRDVSTISGATGVAYSDSLATFVTPTQLSDSLSNFSATDTSGYNTSLGLSGTTLEITDADGTLAQELSSLQDGDGIYDGSGSLSGNTTVTMGGNTLDFSGDYVQFDSLNIGTGPFTRVSNRDYKLMIRDTTGGSAGRTSVVIENASNFNSASEIRLLDGGGGSFGVQLRDETWNVLENVALFSVGGGRDVDFIADGDLVSGGNSELRFKAGGYNETPLITLQRTSGVNITGTTDLNSNNLNNVAQLSIDATTLDWLLDGDGTTLDFRRGGTDYMRLSSTGNLTLTSGDLALSGNNLNGVGNFQSGSTTDTTDGSGDITVAHGHSGTPTSVVVTVSGGGTVLIPVIQSRDGTNFTVRFFNTSGSGVASTSVTFDWIAR